MGFIAFTEPAKIEICMQTPQIRLSKSLALKQAEQQYAQNTQKIIDQIILRVPDA